MHSQILTLSTEVKFHNQQFGKDILNKHEETSITFN